MATPGLAFGVPALFGGLVMIEAGVPLPIPGDVLMLLVGERTAANAVPLWMAVLGLELDVIIGTAALFFLARGPARGLIRRLGPHVGLTEQRLERATDVFEHKGQVAIPVGRATPSLRTLTVLATAASRLTSRRALLLLFLGGSVFVQLHLVLGFFLGPVAESIFQKATVPTLIVLGVLVAGGVVFWLIRHGRRRGAHAWTEATCPACMAMHLIPPQARVAPHELAAPAEG